MKPKPDAAADLRTPAQWLFHHALEALTHLGAAAIFLSIFYMVSDFLTLPQGGAQGQGTYGFLQGLVLLLATVLFPGLCAVLLYLSILARRRAKASVPVWVRLCIVAAAGFTMFSVYAIERL